MSDSTTARNGLRLTWVPVKDAQGRTRMEMRWIDTRAPGSSGATQLPHAA